MAEDGVGLDSQRPPLRGQRHHHRKQHGLHHIDPVEARRTDAAPHGLEQRPVDKLGESGIAEPHLIGERRRGVQQFDRHARPLRSLAGEDEDGSPCGSGLSSYHIRCWRAGRDRPLTHFNNSSRSAPTTTARWSNDARVVTSEYATSCGSTSECCSTNRRNRAACSANADADFADNTHGTTSGRLRADSAAANSGGACSSITWAFVPLMPNADTPARRGRSVWSGHGRALPTTSIVPDDQSTCGVGESRCNVAGTTPCRIDSTVLITPATPAAYCA